MRCKDPEMGKDLGNLVKVSVADGTAQEMIRRGSQIRSHRGVGVFLVWGGLALWETEQEEESTG